MQRLPASALLEPLRNLPLLRPELIREVESLASEPGASARALADELTRRGLLTTFQADELASGRGYGLALGPYVLLERLGAGGMGEVFRVRHELMRREFALKRMLPALLHSADSVERFLREVAAASLLSHPNIVSVLNADRAGDSYYMVMELLPGVNLAERLRKQGMSVGTAVECVRQACVGMQHAHEKGLVHRDLKPQNLMLCDGRMVKILDLGLALVTSASALTETGQRFGTWDFMAPEQAADSSRVDIRADVFSLGCTLYYLLTGRTPFVGKEIPALRPSMHLTHRPEPVEDLNEAVPPRVAEAVRKMMAPTPEARFRTPGEAAAVLGSFLRRAQPGQAVVPTREVFPISPEIGRGATPAVSARLLPSELTDRAGMRFVLVEPGAFWMGSPYGEEDRKSDEEQHEVTITRAFYVSAYPVTQGNWEKIMGHNPSYFCAVGGGKARVKDVGEADLGSFPVERVSWEDAQAYLARLAEAEPQFPGWTYRLPTEAQWEYACRGGHKVRDLGERHRLPFHLDAPAAALSSWQATFDGSRPYGGAAKGPYRRRPTKVGSHSPNVLGVFDMHGNVWEWCADWFAPYPAEQRCVDPAGPGEGSLRCRRGGCWFDHASSCRSANRDKSLPETRSDGLGFRVVLVPAI